VIAGLANLVTGNSDEKLIVNNYGVNKIWNNLNLPTLVIEACSLPVFRRRLKTHLFTVAFEASG